MKWIKADAALPEHNNLVFAEHRNGSYRTCIFKHIYDERLGYFIDLFVPIDDMEGYDEPYYFDNTKDWYRDHHNWDKVYVDRWILWEDVIKETLESTK